MRRHAVAQKNARKMKYATARSDGGSPLNRSKRKSRILLSRLGPGPAAMPEERTSSCTTFWDMIASDWTSPQQLDGRGSNFTTYPLDPANADRLWEESLRLLAERRPPLTDFAPRPRMVGSKEAPS